MEKYYALKLDEDKYMRCEYDGRYENYYVYKEELNVFTSSEVLFESKEDIIKIIKKCHNNKSCEYKCNEDILVSIKEDNIIEVKIELIVTEIK